MKKIIIAIICLTIVLSGCNANNTEQTTKHIEESLKIEVAGGNLSAVLTIPNNENSKTEEFPVILFVPGSGPVPKDGTSKEFKQLATALADNNIATLRYDKRGTFDSQNIKINEADIKVSDFVNDIKVIIKYLKADKRFSKIYLLGHSQGGLFGALAIKDESVDGFISLAATARTLDKVIEEQLKNNKANPPKLIEESVSILKSLKEGKKVEKINDNLKSLFRYSVQDFLIDWMSYDPVEIYKEINNIPLLLIQGKHDIQVSVEDADMLSKARPDAKLILIDNMTHVLKDSKKKDDLSEQMRIYKDFDKPINQEVAKSIIDFIN